MQMKRDLSLRSQLDNIENDWIMQEKKSIKISHTIKFKLYLEKQYFAHGRETQAIKQWQINLKGAS